MPPWFDQEVSALEQRTKLRCGTEKLVLFYGSSTFTLWADLEAYFPAYNVVNHGFGGSTLADCVEYFDRLVVPLRPAVILLYAGDNDLDNGARPEQVVASLEAILARKRATLGAVPLGYISIKVSVARLHFMHAIGYTNRIAERRLSGEQDAVFIDFTRRLVARGYHSWKEYFSHDPLHMNGEGYRVLAKTLSEYLTLEEGRLGDLKVATEGITPKWVVEPALLASDPAAKS